MKNRLEAALKELKANKGSGIVLVLVCMLCVSILGIMILYLSYTGLLIKVTERQSQENFYDASSAMDEVRAGVQKATSDSISKAYKTMLSHYSDPEYAVDMSSKFKEEFKKEFYKWQTTVTIGGTTTPKYLIAQNLYSTDVLKAFVTSQNSEVSGSGTVEYNDNAKTITLKSISVKYTNPKTDYATSVTSDIRINIPDFSYVISNYSVSGLPSYALIAQKTISCSALNDSMVQGSAYGGMIDLPNTFANVLTFKDGTVISGGNVIVAGTKTGCLTADKSSSLWANRINVQNSSSVLLQGNTYVQDDLELAKDSNATIAGNYYGFGSSTSDATQSSAILVNGSGTTLDLRNVSRMMLAGHSFVWNNGTDKEKTDVMMGESISVRENQMAYLVPTDYLDGATENPLIFTDDEPNVTLVNEALWDNKTFTDYGATLYKVHYVYPGGQDQKIVYYFVKFSSSQDANNYFKDYFTHNAAKINSYISNYTTLSSATGNTQAAGWTIKSTTDANNKVTYTLGTVPQASIDTSAAQIKSTYSQLRTTLFAGGASAVSGTPYTYVIDTAKVSAITGSKTFSKDGNAVGIIVNNADSTPYAVSSAGNDICVIVATGDVVVDKAFSGLIIAGGNIDLQASVSASDSVSAAFGAISGDGSALSTYFSHGAGNTGASNNNFSNGWNFDVIVTYQNWNKH